MLKEIRGSMLCEKQLSDTSSRTQSVNDEFVTWMLSAGENLTTGSQDHTIINKTTHFPAYIKCNRNKDGVSAGDTTHWEGILKPLVFIWRKNFFSSNSFQMGIVVLFFWVLWRLVIGRTFQIILEGLMGPQVGGEAKALKDGGLAGRHIHQSTLLFSTVCITAPLHTEKWPWTTLLTNTPCRSPALPCISQHVSYPSSQVHSTSFHLSKYLQVSGVHSFSYSSSTLVFY